MHFRRPASRTGTWQRHLDVRLSRAGTGSSVLVLRLPRAEEEAGRVKTRRASAGAFSPSALARWLAGAPVSVAFGMVAALAVVYLAMIAVAIGYADLTIEFSQSVRNDEASVAALESEYLAEVAALARIDYTAAGYAKPASADYVRTASPTALR